MLECESLRKTYGGLTAVDDLTFSLEKGEFATLLGPSGCGKSTTLHMIAGLTEPTSGRIRIQGRDVTGTPPEDRNIGMVFQNTALFPHMDVRQNLAYGLRMRNVSDARIEERVDELLDMVEMPTYGSYTPSELSGGQKQRIGIARALAFEPDLLLLDEPLTGLDRVLRETMRKEIERIQRDVDVTTLYVTHDQKEALSMSDRVIVLDEGRKQQEGRPEDIYTAPARPFVAEFIGKSTVLEGTVDDPEVGIVRTDFGRLEAADASGKAAGASASLYVRPEHVQVSTTSDGDANELEGTVATVDNLGEYSEVDVRLDDGTEMLAKMEAFPSVGPGDAVYVRFELDEVIVL